MIIGVGSENGPAGRAEMLRAQAAIRKTRSGRRQQPLAYWRVGFETSLNFTTDFYVNSGRALTFVLLSSVFMMSAIVLQNYFAPKQDADDGAQVAAVDPADSSQDGEASQDEDQAGDDPVTKLTEGSTDSAAGESAAETQETAPDAEVERVAEDDFVMIGSLQGTDRYLITINKRGGTIRRVELNFRNSKGGYKYRDLVWEGGYLGCLDCADTGSGPQVRAVGLGTPAQIAGVKQGDVIVSVRLLGDEAGESEPITSADDFESFLESKTEPGDELELVVDRAGAKRTMRVGLTDKPIQVIRPEPGVVDPEFDFPESFVVSLLKPDRLEMAWPDLDHDMRDKNWEVVSADANQIEMKFELSQKKLADMGIAGPLTVFKRIKMPATPTEIVGELDSRSFHLKFELEIKNESSEEIKLAFEIDGPTGLTAETWWYANKIHGRQTAIGYIAGARDIVGSNGINSYVFYGCPEIVKEISKAVPKAKWICDPFKADLKYRQLNFVGVDSHYFNVSMIPEMTDGDVFETNSVQAFLNARDGRTSEVPKNARLQKLVDCTFIMVAPATIPAGESYQQSFDLFVGPKDSVLLKHYGLSDVRTFGWFSWCSMVLLKILHFFYFLTFKTSYGLAIVMLTILVRCLMIPMSRKAALNAQMMQHLQPQMKEIADKYKDDMEKRASAQRELYKKYKFNPFGGCFMMFFQLPVFYGLYKGLNVDIALRDQPLIPGMQWCSNLAAPDQLFYWKDIVHSSLGAETGWLGPYFNLLPILTMILFIAQQKLFTPPPTDDNQKMMHKMMTFMMVFMGIMFFKVPAGLCIYFITSSLWGIIERKMLPKPVLDTGSLSLEGETGKQVSKRDQKAATQASMKREADTEARKSKNAERKKRLSQRRRDDNGST
ncbi:MAG: YidC/Oxa1 family membrane protein insertase [Mariniblastus sp.]